MLCLGIEFLTGYYVATHPSARDMTEWPPHPARVFMAMAAAHFETGEDSAEAKALTFIEKIGKPPTILATPAQPRSVVTHYVPVNDDLGPAGAPLPILRSRQPREFPRVRPDDPVLYYCWADADADAGTAQALRGVCGKVTRIGHSSSLVRMWLAEGPTISEIHDRWVPDGLRPREQLRAVTPGGLDELRRLYRAEDMAEFDRLDALVGVAKGKAKKEAKQELAKRFGGSRPQPVRPEFQVATGYSIARSSERTPTRSVWSSQLLIFGLRPLEGAHARMGILSSQALVNGLRRAMLKVAGQLGPVPELISGHRPDADSSPSDKPHCAIMPLPFVGREHADGHILGVAIALPEMVSTADRRLIVRAAATILRDGLRLGQIGKWKLVPGAEFPALYTIRADVWTGGSDGAKVWESVTPVAFDEHPKSKDIDGYQNEIGAMIRKTCTRIGLPEPQRVDVSHVSFVKYGVPTAYQFPRLARKDGSLRRQLHARIVFSMPVIGPVLLGAGRYRGYGLFKPLLGGENNG
ncbi:MAG: type I-G CRISPR-associated protein Csb2 [Phycisphaerae bacterium]